VIPPIGLILEEMLTSYQLISYYGNRINNLPNSQPCNNVHRLKGSSASLYVTAQS